jgi:AraC-like DNA-binding protein
MGADVRPADSRLFERAQSVISVQYAEPDLNLAKVAMLLDVSRWRVSRAFSASHVGFRSCVRQARMMAAAVRLRENVAIKEVAVDLGYRHAGEFSKHFRQRWGITPTAFRGGRLPAAAGAPRSGSLTQGQSGHDEPCRPVGREKTTCEDRSAT